MVDRKNYNLTQMLLHFQCFGSRADLGNHKLTHEKNEAAMTDYTLAKQRPSIDVREEGGLFKCSECGSAFEQRFMCVRHIWRHNLQKPEFFVCGTCQKVCHFLIHLDEVV